MPVLRATGNINASPTSSALKTRGLQIAMLGWILCLLIAYRDRDRVFSGIDFTSFYSCTRCLVAGCNPYDHVATFHQFLQMGGSMQQAGPPPKFGPFLGDYAGYPAVPMFYAIPLAHLHWPWGLWAWLAIGIAAYTWSIYLTSTWVSEFSPILGNICLSIFILFGRLAIDLANPALLAAALAVAGVLLILRARRPWIGIVCYAASLVLKPHLGIALLLYFMLANASLRKRVAQVLGSVVLICVPALLWVNTQPASRHWYRDYTGNLRNIAGIGHLSDPGPTNSIADKIADLQTVASLVRNDPGWYNHVVWAFSLGLLALWLIPVLRLRAGLGKDLVAVAGLACFSLLPYYHRSYDTRVLLVTFPGLAWAMARFPHYKYLAAAASTLMSFLTTDDYDRWMDWLLMPFRRSLGPLRTQMAWQMTLGRPVCNSILVLALCFLAVLWAMWGRQGERTVS